MKARPILFATEMVRALLDGRKTQTRRVIRPQPSTSDHAGDIEELEGYPGEWFQWLNGSERSASFVCPYGVPVDLLWVKERCWLRPPRTPRMMREGADTWPPVMYFADDQNDKDWCNEQGWLHRVSIHMPRSASRLTLRLTEVRVQRVQDISEEDAKAEGCKSADYATGREILFEPEKGSYRIHFRDLWDRINAARGYGWAANPYVWALSFEVIKANVDQVLKEAA